MYAPRVCYCVGNVFSVVFALRQFTLKPNIRCTGPRRTNTHRANGRGDKGRDREKRGWKKKGT